MISKIAYKVVRTLNLTARDKVQINDIGQEDWKKYYRCLWNDKHIDEKDDVIIVQINIEGLYDLNEEFLEVLEGMKNLKATGLDCFNILFWFVFGFVDRYAWVS